MGTLERIKEDLKSSLKSGLADRVGVLRLMLAELQNKEKEKYAKSNGFDRLTTGTGLDEDEVISVLQKEAKKRKEPIELFRKGGREDLVKKEESELKIIEEYLPRQMPPAEICAHVEKLIGQGIADFNSLMKESIKELKGKVEGGKLAEVIKERLK